MQANACRLSCMASAVVDIISESVVPTPERAPRFYAQSLANPNTAASEFDGIVDRNHWITYPS